MVTTLEKKEAPSRGRRRGRRAGTPGPEAEVVSEDMDIPPSISAEEGKTVVVPWGRTPEAMARRKEIFLTLYEKSLCNVSSSCRRMKLRREVVYRWRKEDPVFTKKMDEVKEIRLDFYEEKLNLEIQSGNTAALLFALKCQGKNRGWVERTEITGEDGGPVQSHNTLEVIARTVSREQMDAINAELGDS